MKKNYLIYLIITLIIFSAGCTPSYKARPLSFKHPSAYPNTTQVANTIIGSRAFVDKKEAQEAFGFDVRSAGMLPVQIVADNQGQKGLDIVANQTFLQDKEGNLWPVLTDKFAYERVTKYAQTKEIFKEGAYAGVMSATAGALIGAAIGAAAGGTAGGLKGYDSAYQARREVMEDFESKSLKNKSLSPNNLSYGFIFFPGEAKSAQLLRLQLKEEDSNRIFTINLKFE